MTGHGLTEGSAIVHARERPRGDLRLAMHVSDNL
jgi:hypothetical protein